MSKKKKEKIVYYDDGSTIADMSAVGGTGRRAPQDKPKQEKRVGSTFREKWATYWNTVKMMVFPMLVVLLILAVLFLMLLIL